MAPKRSREDPEAKEQKSLLSSAAEIAFPRGGASILTPMEMKEVSNKAKRDVLFEQNSKNESTSTSEPSKKRSKKSKKLSILSKDEQDEENEKKIVTVDTLSYNILNTGSYVLGMIKQINQMELILSLPDNLTGYVPITNISTELIHLLQDFDDQNDSDSDSDSDSDNDDDKEKENLNQKLKEFPSLEKRFSIGQYLRAKIVPSTNEKFKKRIELSIEPEKVNDTMDENDDFISNSIVQASVVSLEDHGAILKFGKQSKLSGFISKKELTSNSINVDVGSVILVYISNINPRTATCKFPIAVVKKQPMVSSISTINSLLPGMIVDATIEDILNDGLVCKVHSLCDGTVSFQHLGPLQSLDDIKHKFSIGSIIKARIIASYLKNGQNKLSLSILPCHQTLTYCGKEALEAFPIGHILDNVTVKGKDTNFIFVDLMSGDIPGSVHKSRISKTSDLDLDFKLGSTHKARILDYSDFDNIYILTLDAEKIEVTYLRANDIPIGQKITCEIEKVSTEGIVVKLENDFKANVPAFQISDIKLVYPERKFKIGSKVKGRILNVKQLSSNNAALTVTLKRSYVNADDSNIITSYDDLKSEMRALATVEKILPNGCVVSFFGGVSAFLPNSEISETFVENAADFVKLGQTVNVRIVDFNKEQSRCLVSLRISADMSSSQRQDLDNLIPGKSIVNAEVIEKEKNLISVKIDGTDLRGIINVGQLSDSTIDNCRGQLKKIKIGEKIECLVLLIDHRKRGITLSAKPSLISDAKNGTLPTHYEDISVSDKVLHGYVKTVIPSGVFVSFGNNLTGLVIPKFASFKRITDLTTAFNQDQSVDCTIINVDEKNNRFLVSLLVETANSKDKAENPIDSSIKKLGDYSIGKITKCEIKAIEKTHLLVKLSDNQDGRIDLSEIFDNVSDIKDLNNPLVNFQIGQKIKKAKVIGYYDLERQKYVHSKKVKSNLVDLTIKPKNLETVEAIYPLAFNDIKEGDNVLGYILSIQNGYFWYAISPAQKAKMSFVDVTDDVSKLENFNEEFKVGTIVPAKVTNVDVDHYAINVSGRSRFIKSTKDVKVGDILPSLILNVRDNSVLVSLGENVTGVSMVTDALDDYTLRLSDVFHVGEFHQATVVSTDHKIYVSLRSKNPKDRLINTIEDIKRGDIVRGYINKINNSGLFVDLGRSVYALVRISDMSDSVMKNWREVFSVNQSIKGRILEANHTGRVLMSLKNSIVNGDLKNLKMFSDLKIGDVYEGSIKKVEEYGVFVTLDGTDNVSGLCHRSEITDAPIKNAEDIFKEGERVKVKILDINEKKRQLSLGMKASYFRDGSESDNDDEDDDVDMDKDNNSDAEIEDEEMLDASDNNDDDDNSEENEDESEDEDNNTEGMGLSTGSGNGLSTGFDWTASILEQAKDEESSDEEEEFEMKVNKKSKKTVKEKSVEDKTGDLDTRAPQSISDFERLLVGNPDSSILWIQYMSFQLQLSEIEKAREIAERALKTINFREEQQKMNIWIALLNLENSFGDDETLESVFKKSCQYMDAYTMHQKLVAIYIASEKYDKANKLFGTLCKKFGAKNPGAWVSYGNFLIDRNDNEEAHKILARSLQILPKRNHVDVVRKFAQLEFQKGDAEQGRSLFEGLLSDVPKRIDLWNVYIDQEIKVDNKKKVDELFERVIEKKLTRKQAKFFFAKWLNYEEQKGDEKSQDYVKAKAAEFAQKLSK
ncbi:rRNA biogenesis protein rrp5 [Pichia californica]|uniref:rRNA biogenesis protein rrp5 n=1 Tax=Pichia californica TaxID=460514 RepID=A0A9P6WKS8_9ASCO|nr:rRNA biogenesis protein rrp5 [[Candida] californica]KAG0688989.1 rRNA biogenesis protein rrp5 [[Candida] californica]